VDCFARGDPECEGETSCQQIYAAFDGDPENYLATISSISASHHNAYHNSARAGEGSRWSSGLEKK
jgi:hypothetical protein